MNGIRINSGDDLEVQVILQRFGQIQDYCGTDPERGQCPLMTRSRAWLYRTPFIPRRYPKVTQEWRGQAGCERPADRQSRARSPAAAGRNCLSQADEAATGSWHEPGRKADVMARLPEQQSGMASRARPVAVWYAAHFGMRVVAADK